MFMKFLKNIFLLFILSLFILSGLFLQGSIALKNTLFSHNYFQKILNENNISSNIEKLAEDIIDNSDKFININDIEKDSLDITPEAQKLIDSYKATMKENIDTNLMKEETLRAIDEVYSYFFLGNEKLPIIDIKPGKEIYTNLLVQQIIITSDQEISKQIDEIVPYVKLISRLYPRDTVINELMKLEQIKTMNLSREEITAVVSKIMDSGNIKSEELYNYIATKIIRDKIDLYGLNEIKDQLDLNLLFKIKYGGEYNPVTGSAKILNTIKKEAFLAIVITYILTLLIIAITAYNPRKILRWVGTGMLLSGIIVMISYRLLRIINYDIISYIKGINLEAKGLDIIFIQNWVLSYINGIWKSMFICASIFAVLGAIFIILSFFIYKLFNEEADYKVIHQKFLKKSLIITLRILTVLVLLIAISLNNFFNINKIRTSVEDYKIIKEKAKINAMDTNEAMGKVLNAEKLMNIMR